ncbi:MAG TPA: prephenate dehydratase domain-containing protein [Allosphingosinicella sp.]|nr:prephenate dehydratase domain-containing protein [Allosphingosinicella sp.]
MILYQGVPGAFSHEACLAFVPGEEAVPAASFADVVRGVADGRAPLGMLPLENSIAGEVPGVGALIDAAGLRIEAEHVLAVRLHLVGLAEAELGEVRVVASHPMALKQCARTLARLGLAGEEAENTAVAVKNLASRDRAALGSEAAARIYGRKVLMCDLQDEDGNATRFGIVSRGS